MTDQTPARPIRPVDQIAETYVEECLQHEPELATQLGIAGHDDEWGDYSMDGHLERITHVRKTIAALHGANPVDARENLAKESMLERLGLEVELFEAHITTSRVSVVAGPVQKIRSTFDLMPVDSAEAWANIAARLRTVHAPLHQVRQTLATEAVDGNISALRQVRGTVDQIGSWTGQSGADDFFSALVARVPADLDPALHGAVAAAADQARTAFAEHAEWLTDDLAPLAPGLDAVGEERYALDSRSFLGATIDLQETYTWGWAEAGPDPGRTTPDRPHSGGK